MEAALKDQQLQREREERERRWREEERKREIQRERIRQLDEWLAAWRRCADVRAFIAAARASDPLWQLWQMLEKDCISGLHVARIREIMVSVMICSKMLALYGRHNGV